MAVPTSPAGRRPRLADRLAAARRRRFVGRKAELALFAAALADPEPPYTSPLEALARRGVLMVDTYETLGPLDAWLREALLPELPGGHLVVLAGRDPPAAGWLADAGWRDLARVVPLRMSG